ncbi:YceI family protein [Halocola ammonii]
MKKNLLASLAFSLSAIFAFASGGEESDKQSFTVDTKSSKIEWRGEKVTGYHTGTVNLSEGNMEVEDGRITSGNFTIDMTSIENTDIEDEGTKAKLIGHLKSDDFFSVSSHKTANFNLTSFRPMKEDENGNNYMVKGELTIKGITNEISFPANVKIDGDRMVAKADVTFDRTKWKVRYGSGSFFDSLGDNMIYDDVEIKLNIVGKV